ncbi:hypothetical protein N9X74_02410 [Porticoccaceae bacterium]|nr:hypothetical protein [Porticoccaceae bacterium]
MRSHFVLSYSRTIQLRELVSLLVRHFPSERVLIADSGQRGEKLSEILGPLYGQVIHIETVATGADSNMKAVEDYIDGPCIFYHDDDLFHPEKLKLSLKSAEENESDFMVSMKEDRDSFGLHSGNYDIIPSKSVMLSYFLDPYGNCPLMTGMYFRNKDVFRRVMSTEMLWLKYSDVLIVVKAVEYFTNIQIGAYMQYNEHDGNDNNVRDIAARDALSVGLRSYGDRELNIVSYLIYHGYARRLNYYIYGLILMLTSRFILTKYLSKLVVKLGRRFTKKSN